MHECFILDLGKEDRKLRGEIILPAAHGIFPTVILIHGFKGFKDWGFFPLLAKQLVEHGFGVVTFTFSMSGIGENPETFTELDKFAHSTYSREQEDLQFLLKSIQSGNLPLSSHLDVKKISLFGHSRGGGNSILFGIEHSEIRAIATWNSIHRVNFFDPLLVEEILREGMGYIPNIRTGQHMPIHREVLEDIERNQERFAILNRLPDLHCPLFILQGDRDHPSLVNGAPQLAKAATHASLHIIAGADHTLGMKHPASTITPHFEEAVRETIQFYQYHL